MGGNSSCDHFDHFTRENLFEKIGGLKKIVRASREFKKFLFVTSLTKKDFQTLQCLKNSKKPFKKILIYLRFVWILKKKKKKRKKLSIEKSPGQKVQPQKLRKNRPKISTLKIFVQ